jgi:glycine oxidase
MDVAIAGGGLIGLASALELAQRGAKVCVVDRGDRGQASWAAAGILGPQSEVNAPSPMLDLCRASYALYPELVRKIDKDVGFRACGSLHLAFTESEAAELDAQARWQREAGLRVEERRHPGARLAVFLPDEGQVDNRKLLAALREACARSSVTFVRDSCTALDRDRLELASGAEVRVRRTVLCAGSWSGGLADLPVRPVRGQMLALSAPPPDCVVFGGGGYLVPREGRTLVGATSEEAGFDATPSSQGRAWLLGVAARHGLENPEVLDHWAGLRPATRDGLPIFGALPGGALVATGHFRNGVLLTPITARVVAALVLDEPPPVDLAPFRPDR